VDGARAGAGPGWSGAIGGCARTAGCGRTWPPGWLSALRPAWLSGWAPGDDRR